MRPSISNRGRIELLKEFWDASQRLRSKNIELLAEFLCVAHVQTADLAKVCE